VDIPLSQWSKDQVCSWLEELGLENYVADARRWVQGGAHLLACSPQELEKELGVKNPLHKKKLLLAMMALQGPQSDELLTPAGLLDSHWVCCHSRLYLLLFEPIGINHFSGMQLLRCSGYY